jgi:uncharacterized protein
MTKVLYTADLHGNETQYNKLVDYAIETHPDLVIIGGDIAPKGRPMETYVRRQKTFLKMDLPNIFQRLKSNSPNTQVLLMMGNDDCKTNRTFLDEHPNLYADIHNNRITLPNGFNIVGYSYVPITPFGIKDWEKYDLSDISEKDKEEYKKRKESNYRLSGIRSNEKGFSDFKFIPNLEIADSIQLDLSKELFTQNPQKTIYVTHSPPNNTTLDQLHGGAHIGSFAIKEFIDKHQPHLTLHGHIHETVDVTGEYKQRIGQTISASPGNHNIGDTLHLLTFNMEDLSTLERITL